MKKNIIFIIFFSIILISCGKKSNPEYKAEKNQTILKKYVLNFQKL